MPLFCYGHNKRLRSVLRLGALALSEFSSI
jgi:hypothetical protein